MSFSILKTNVGLTTNTKIMIDSKYKLYLESIDSVVELSSQTYKKFEFNKDSLYDETLSLFIGKMPTDLSYAIRYEDDNDNMYTNFYSQNDDLYQCGARNIYNNKGYDEEYEYFAPLYLDGAMPSNFIIFRVDGPGNINLTGANFISEIVNQLKVVRSYDLGRSTILGEWLYKNYVDNEYYINDSLSVDFRDNYFSSVGGIDVLNGGYVRKSLNTNELFSYETTFNDMNTYFHSLYAKNSIVYPNILNLNYLYNDTPSTPDVVREWSINRYYGFYFNSLDVAKRYTFYTPIALVDSVVVGADNVLSYDGDNPFVDINSTTDYFVEIGGVYSKIAPFDQVVGYGLVNVPGEVTTQKKDVITQVRWKIISSNNYEGYTYADMNNHTVVIGQDGTITGAELPSTDLLEKTDLWLLYLGDEYVVVNIVDSNLMINSDYSFSMKGNNVEMTSGGVVQKTVKGVDSDGFPVSFGLYRCNFTDIKDFDVNLINSDFANFEYDVDNVLVKTDESKLYYSDYSSRAHPVENDEFFINGKVENVPVSSEFIANGETFELINNDLTPLWRKNASWCKWGYTNSLNSYDYPYLLNNSILGEDFNRGVNVFIESPDRSERNLDYFYSIMDASLSKNYKFQTLHTSGAFELGKYLGNFDPSFNYDNDYFSYYFGNTQTSTDGLYVKNKWSKFNDGNGISPNNSLFRGLKINMFDVKSIKLTDNEISEINIESSTSFSDYKFSILASVNQHEIRNTNGMNALVNTVTTDNWIRVGQYDFDVTYNIGDVVMYYGVMWHCLKNNIREIDPNVNPVNSYSGTTPTKNWAPGSGVTFTTVNNFKGMWQPGVSYTSLTDVVFYDGEYMKLSQTGTLGIADFWNPTIGYSINTIVYKGGLYYRAIENIAAPLQNTEVQEPGSSKKWETVSSNITPKWKEVQVWGPNGDYVLGDYVYWDGSLYSYQSQQEAEPGYNDSVWLPMHTLEVASDIVYPMGQLTTIGGEFFVPKNVSNSINSGITIYINKKWKNILININSYDGLVKYMSNTPRDVMYSYENSKLTAFNFIEYINGLNIKKGFSKSLTYVIINEDNSVEYYSGDNITNIPVYVNIEKPDVLYTVIDSLVFKNVDLNMNKFKINFQLDKSNISSLERKNWYNGGIGLATTITKNLNNIQLVNGYHGLTNVIYNRLFRHSGDYSPIFKTVELFVKDINTIGNYKFGTDLANFGMIKDVVVSKVNRRMNILKLNNVLDTRSIYPMIDEFGYTVMDKFIFKSTWDDAFYLEVTNNDQSVSKNNKNNKIIS